MHASPSSFLPLSLLAVPQRHDPNPLILYHDRCADGFAAALAGWLFYDGQVECLGLSHGQISSVAQLPPLQGRCVYVLDFSFPPALLAEIDAQAARLVLLDHHKSAAEQLTGFACRCGGLHFDMHKSGARLAWDYFLPDRPLPDLVRFVQDRDLWTWQEPETAGFVAALDMEPYDFARWAVLAALPAPELAAFVARGQAMDEKFRSLAQDIARAAQPLRFNGQAGLMVNAPGAFHSLVGELLSQRSASFALMWTVADNGVVKVGLRSQRGYDCTPLAQSMGGGGHAQACGFRLPLARLGELLSGDFEA